jgi:predicted dehydrogenase
MAKNLRVGIIGVSADGGWARESHVPAIRATDGLELAAVATRTRETAAAAGAAFGVSRAYGDARDLIADPDVDIVTVAAPVPAHRDLIVAALEAGKHVTTEWPVGTSTTQTEQIAAVGDQSGLRTAVGLQSRMNPAAVRALALIGSGTIGRVLSVTVYSSTAAFGRRIADSALSLEKPETGMNLTTIQTAHTADLAIMLAGRLTSLAALTTIQYPELEAGDPPKPFHRVVPDHVLLHGRAAQRHRGRHVNRSGLWPCRAPVPPDRRHPHRRHQRADHHADGRLALVATTSPASIPAVTAAMALTCGLHFGWGYGVSSDSGSRSRSGRTFRAV